MKEKKKIRVLIVDDSALIRTMFTKILEEDSDIEVVGSAADPLIARDLIKKHNPDVVTLDIEMPRMDGLTFLEKIMTLRPTPVVMVSSMTQERALETIRSLELGAVDCIGKPTGDERMGIEALSEELITKVKNASKAKVKAIKIHTDDEEVTTLKVKKTFDPSRSIIAIGASTGGVEAIREVLPLFPKTMPPILLTQHMPETFTKSFAQRLDDVCALTVHEAMDRQPVEPGNVYIAPGNKHLKLALNRSGHGYYCVLDNGEKVSGHRPSVDVLFKSIAQTAGTRGIGVIMTGMGRDGAEGMLEMKMAGAYNIGQDESSCVVYGMPKAAYLASALDEQVNLKKISERILELCSQR